LQDKYGKVENGLAYSSKVKITTEKVLW